MNEYQLDIFGNEIPVTELRRREQKAKCRTSASIKKQFRERNGYDESHVCEQCKYFEEYKTFTRFYCKCKKIGYGKGTDIEFDDKACKLYEKRWK